MCVTLGHAQNSNNHSSALDDFFGDITRGFEEERKAMHEDFEAFRKKIIEDYAEFLANPWKEEKREAPIPKPKEEPIPPVVMPKGDEAPKPKEDPKPVVIEEVVEPVVVEPQPEPIAPIEEVPVIAEATVPFTFFGTQAKVAFDEKDRFLLKSVNEQAVAKAYKHLAGGSHDNIVRDCLALRTELQLSDWAYLQMIHQMAETIYGKGTNESVLLMAYVYSQSGYKMRFASDGNHLYMLYASKYYIYNSSYFDVDGDNYYTFGKVPSSLYISNAAFPHEQSLSLVISSEQKFTMAAGESVVRQSERYPEVKTSVYCNKNLLEFYNTYPSSKIGENICTKWAVYANTPLQTSVKEQLYPTLRKAIQGKSELEAVNILLNYVQTGFEYGYDSEVWGYDRAFFAEETFNYPYSDCEDHSILFTRLVRDLVGLDCILVFYPGHLASAVCFSDGKAHGDYIPLKGKTFTIADATYINAPVGMTMPDMDNASAKVVLLEK